LNEPFVQVDSISLKLRNEYILKDISLSANRGEVVGIIGRNGSGKSMLFKTMVGFFIPQEGEISIDGENILNKGSFPKNIGALIESPGFLPGYSGYKNLQLLASIQNKITNDEIFKVLKEVGLGDSLDKKVKTYSLGMKQRLGIAQAYMESPDIIILDEPTSGLDKQGVADIRELFRGLAKKGKVILISSHILEDIQTLASRVYELEKGKISRVK